MKTALITGITGQDGSYLAENLLEKGYHVVGVKRRSSSFNTRRIDHLLGRSNKNFSLFHGDMTDTASLNSILSSVQPDEIYNLAAQSHVAVSFEQPEYTAQTVAIGTLRMLEGIIQNDLSQKCKFYQASTSELYGENSNTPQNELTPFYPCSPYAAAKAYAHWITANYRNSHNLFACNGILFNHESPRRGETFVSRKITRHVANMSLGFSEPLELGNLDSKRDWGHARDYVEAMWLMLQQDKPDDFVIATGKQHTVRELVDTAFNYIGEKIFWEGDGVDEVAKDYNDRVVVKVNPKYFRPTEVSNLLGDSSKAASMLG